MNTLTGSAFEAMAQNGFKALKQNCEKINDLNVFPVPDGDTGTNMAATLNGGLKGMEKANKDDLSNVASRLSDGMLFGARGNSGVILSQFFSGIADGLSGLEEADVKQFSFALEKGSEKAYKAVINPVEGTILTVARCGSEYVSEHLDEINDFETLFRLLKKKMAIALSDTPNQLPVLKEAGVIDSGGAGLLTIIDGMEKHLLGEDLEDFEVSLPHNSFSSDSQFAFNEDSELIYGYCTEFILQLLNSKGGIESFDLQAMIDYFTECGGDSIVALRQGNIVKTHVHTKTPWKMIEYAQRFGEFLTFKMENMSLQHEEVALKELAKEKERLEHKEKVAIVSVAPSMEIKDLYRKMGASQIVMGGQTMNPSSEDFVNAFDAANAETIIVFPNNGNVILTAQQAAKLYEGKAKVVVVPSKSVVEAYSALSMIDFDNASIEENLNQIKESISNVSSLEFTQAVRDSVNDGFHIKKGQYIGIASGEVVSVAESLLGSVEAALSHFEGMDEASVFTIFYGRDCPEREKAAFREFVDEKYPLLDLMEIEASQPVYPFILAIE
ncbi:MAG: DAK2 domain-containing protein [Bacillota bacterium]|nr:DAK2 domain-containing protein [Bacillota bacterium]